MKKKLKEMHDLLQLFAEESDEENGINPNAVKVEPKEPVTGKENGKEPRMYTDAEMNEIIGRKFAKWKAEQEKAVSEAKKLAEMNATQKAEYERDQLKKELEGYKREKVRNSLAAEARKILSDDGIHICDELLSMLIGDDAEVTKTNIASFSKMFKEAVQSGIKELYKGGAPKAGASAKPPTKEEILAIKDPALRQSKIAENIELFQK